MEISECATCHGQRLKKSSLAVTINNKNFAEVCSLSIEEFLFMDY